MYVASVTLCVLKEHIKHWKKNNIDYREIIDDLPQVKWEKLIYNLFKIGLFGFQSEKRYMHAYVGVPCWCDSK